MTSNLEQDIKDLKKDHGQDSISLATEIPDMEIIPTGSVSLDFATGVGGFPRGMMIEIMGPYSVGKTALAYYGIAEAQKKGIPTAFINLEGIFDLEWAEKISGLDGSKLAVGTPNPGIDAVKMLSDIVHSGKFGYVVFDSIGAMIDDAEIAGKDGKPGKLQPGGAAALVTSMINRNMSFARRNGTTIVFINQLRETIGAMYPMTHAPGGRALGFASTIIVRMKPTQDKVTDTVFGDKKEVARRVTAILEKNKVGAPNATATWMFYNEQFGDIEPGIDRVGEVIDLAMKINVIDRKGAYYVHETFGGNLQGQDAVREFLRTNPDAFQTVRDEIIAIARSRRKNEDTS